MTDLEKWGNFLTEMKIPWHIEDDFNVYKEPIKTLVVGSKYDKDSDTVEYWNLFYSLCSNPAIYIVFSTEGTFKYFKPFGE